jgi:NADH-quinone oxidoreductase subunit C
MSEEKVLSTIQKKFGSTLIDIYKHNERRTYITVDKSVIPEICRYMVETLGGRLAIASGIDTRSGFEILYHIMFTQEHLMITMKTKVKKTENEIESLAPFLPAATWIEREMYDILGITFSNHPDPRRILMADDWPEGDYPFRRDFKEPER